MNRLICQICNANLAPAARLLGVEEAKGAHDAGHRLAVLEAADAVINHARKLAAHLPDGTTDPLRQALAEYDQVVASLGRGYLEYDYSGDRTGAAHG